MAASVVNRTDVPISVHWHGLLIPGALDGGPHLPVAPGAEWHPRLPIDQPPATLWYHTHLHGETAPRVYAGLAGVLIVDDGNDADRGLPATDGVDDLVLVLQDKRLAASGEAVYRPGDADLMHGFLGDAAMVNGEIGARMAVPQGIVRLRLVNAANARNFDLSFADGRPFALIAIDQGLLPRPLTLTRLRLTPGERVELLVDFASGSETTLMSTPHAETAGTMKMGGMMHDMLPLPETFTAPFPVVAFAVDAALPAAVRTIPASFDVPEEALPSPSTTRRFVLNDMGAMMGGGMKGMMDDAANGAPAGPTFGINGRPFDMGRLDLKTALGTTENVDRVGRDDGPSLPHPWRPLPRPVRERWRAARGKFRMEGHGLRRGRNRAPRPLRSPRRRSKSLHAPLPHPRTRGPRHDGPVHRDVASHGPVLYYHTPTNMNLLAFLLDTVGPAA